MADRSNDPQWYRAKLIVNGKVINQARFEAKPREAFNVAHAGINPLSGQWVEIKPIRQPERGGQ